MKLTPDRPEPYCSILARQSPYMRHKFIIIALRIFGSNETESLEIELHNLLQKDIDNYKKSINEIYLNAINRLD